jgi:hypothetical protein
MATEADVASKAKVDKANEANKADKAIVADEAMTNVIDVIIAAYEAIVTNKQVITTIVIDRANLANKANKANLTKANKSPANNGIAIFLYSLAKYCEVFTKDVS